MEEKMNSLMSWYRDLSLRYKLVMLFLVVGLIPFAINAYIAVQRTSEGLQDAAFSALQGVRDARRAEVNNYLVAAFDSANALAQSVRVNRDAGYARNNAINNLKAQALETYFEDLNLLMFDVQKNVRFTDGIKLFSEAFRQGLDSEVYKSLRREREAGFIQFTETFGIRDVHLIDAEGNVTFTIAGESDLGANLKTGSLRNSGLGRVFGKARYEPAIEDFSFYDPANEQAMFISTPLIDNAGYYWGQAAFEINPDAINKIAQEREGMRDTFESFLVGEVNGKYYYRSDRVVKDGKIGEERAALGYTKAVLSGQSGAETEIGSTGVLEVAIYRPLNIQGINWGIITTGSLVQAVVPELDGGRDYLQWYQEENNYYDIFLIDATGEIFYTIKREADFGTNIIDGQYSNSNLGKLIQSVKNTRRQGFSDLAVYAPSNGPAMFAASPVVTAGKVDLFVALQLNIEEIDDIMQGRAGLGQTGHAYLVGPDFYMRSNVAGKDTQLKQEARTAGTQAALANESGIRESTSFLGEEVLAAYTDLGFNENFDAPFEWGMVVEVTQAEALAAVEEYQQAAIVLAVIILVLVAIVAWIVGTGISRPILGVADTVRKIANDQDLTIQAPVTSRDEIGGMTEALNHMLGVLRGSMQVVQSAAEGVEKSSADVATRAGANRERAGQQKERAENAKSIIGEMGGAAGQVAAFTSEQNAAAMKANDAVNKMLKSMDNVAAAAIAQNEEVGTTMERVQEMGATGAKVVSTAKTQGEMVGKVTASMNEMTSAVEEMTKTVAQATQEGHSVLSAAQQGRSTVQSTVEGMKAIAESSEQISEIIGVITEIAEQTNLLALNAAIEAARAGAHGKGFAVVADEVGKLAQRSSEAAKEITQLIKDSTSRVSEGSRLSDESQQSLVQIDEGGRRNMDAIQAIEKTSRVLSSSATSVQSLMGELNRLAQEIGTMATEQGTRRQAAETSLRSMIEHTRTIGNLVTTVNADAQMIGQEMQGILQRSAEMANMTTEQAKRAQKVTMISNETAETAAQTVEGAGIVVGITDELKEVSNRLTQQVRQFKI
jgi:methyl-accepting chemotaxis protein